MKVLVIANMFPSKRFPTYGTFIRNFCNQLNEIGVQYEKVVMYKQTNTIKKMLSYAFFYFSSFFRTLFSNYDAIYVHYPSYSSLAVLIANKWKKKPLYVNVHGSDVFPTNKKQEGLEINTRRAINQAYRVVVPSEYFKSVIVDKYQYPKKRIQVYPSGGVDSKVFYPYSIEKITCLKKEAGLDPDKVTIGYISRLYKLKGWDTFINAVEKLSNYYDKVQFIMVGSGPDEQEIDRILSEKKLTNVVHRFPAQPQEKLADYYNMLDIFVFAAAAAESLGLVAIEAMACGAPVFASDYAAPKYYVEDGENGYKFPLGNFEKLSSLIESFISLSDEEKEHVKLGAIKTAKMYNTDASKKVLRELMK